MADTPPTDISVSEFLRRLDAGWADLQAFLGGLTPEQMTGPADAVGWTVRDHLIHIVVWEDGMNALFEGESRRERMGIPENLWGSDDYDQVNAVIQTSHKGDSLDSVLSELTRVHNAFRAHIAAMSDADLLRPYSSFTPDSTSSNPIVWTLVGNSFGHYEEHLPWMQAIVAQT